jgi:hypothetical protein
MKLIVKKQNIKEKSIIKRTINQEFLSNGIGE